MPFTFHQGDIEGILIVETKAFPDNRGYLFESFKRSDFESHGIYPIVQENHSHSKKGVVRGLHYQRPPFEQGKLVRVVKGEVVDVAVDIRQGSPTFGKWTSIVLSEENRNMVWMPPGFAHGFQVLSDGADLVYRLTHNEYDPQAARSIAWNDPDIAIDWPLEDILLSDKDAQAPFLRDAEVPFKY